MLNLAQSQSMRSQKPQQGYVLFLMMIFMVSVTVVPLLHHWAPSPETLSLRNDLRNRAILDQAGHQLTVYLQSIPEIYATGTNGSFSTPETIPGPGYLPCPDTNQDHSSNAPCGQGRDFAWGRLPWRIASRNFTFLHNQANPPEVWYAVDSRYVIQNTDYHNPPSKRYSPLNPARPGDARLSINEQGNYVALLFITPERMPTAGTELETVEHLHLPDKNHPNFIKNGAMFWTLSHAEWRQLVQRKARESMRLCSQLAADQPHWFNACRNDERNEKHCSFGHTSGVAQNPNGSGWRQRICP